MSQRIHKAESLVRQIVASEVPQRVPHSAQITVTGVDVSPDLRNATVWVGVVETARVPTAEVYSELVAARDEIQAALAGKMTTKFVPRLTFELDEGGRHAEHINRVLKEL